MIDKFVRLKTIGKFLDCRPRGDVQLRKLTLVYGENGRGKTTLCAVLRALAEGERFYIDERRTLGSTDTPEAEVLTDAGLIKLVDGGWSQPFPKIAVYDTTFVHDNVYAGEYVDHDHKKNLHRIIVGKKGVQLARRIDDLDQDSRNAARDVREKRSAAARYAPESYDVDAFVELPKRPDVDKEIQAVEKELASLSEAAEIQARAELSQATTKALPTGFRQLLGKTIQDVATGAEEKIHRHIEQHTAAANERWLSEGLGYLKADDCPFCGLSVADNELIKAYRAFFSRSYEALKGELSNTAEIVDSSLGDYRLSAVQKTILSNEALLEFWRRFLSIELPAFDFESLQRVGTRLRTAAVALVNRKRAAPLEPVTDVQALDAAEGEYSEVVKDLATYNEAVDRANAAIQSHKAAVGAANLTQKQSQLLELKAAKARHEPNAMQACALYVKAQLDKSVIETEKARVRAELDDYSRTIFSTYTRRINALLENFNATFRIANLVGQYTGGHPSSTYHVLINDQAVGVGDRDTPRGTPCFRTTLSAGDRSTIALAFFIARIENDPELAETVVVFDDPFTSQDRFRRTCTQQLICRKVDECCQVIVLSHDPHFLKLIWDHCNQPNTKTLIITRAGADNATIQELDIDKETQGDYFQDHAALTAYLYNSVGVKRDIAKRIRPLLEGYLRVRFPTELPPDKWLGDLISTIRDAPSGSPLEAWKGQPLDELTDINDYSKKFHHDTNPSAASETVDDGELQSFVRRTLRSIGGY